MLIKLGPMLYRRCRSGLWLDALGERGDQVCEGNDNLR